MLKNTKGAIPLYMQIKDLLITRIAESEWAPGAIIPSEIVLAQELKVSHGTVRRAITELVEKNILTRRQGKGTFVANHNHERALFHFFHLVNDHGDKTLPVSQTLSCKQKRATRKEIAALQLDNNAQVICIERIRSLEGQAVILEKIVLAVERFGDLGKPQATDLPNNLYELYESRFGITIARADEQLRAIGASARAASALGLEAGAPLLEIKRVALSLDGTPVELRISHCYTAKHYYENAVF